MSGRDRLWLREFLDLGARQNDEGIPEADIIRQEDTVLRSLEVLRARPGIVLADEVGMGKTYEALGIVAAFRKIRRNPRIVVVAPGPDLVTKWCKEIVDFERHGKLGRLLNDPDDPQAFGLENLAESGDDAGICVISITKFSRPRSREDKGFLLSLYGYAYHVHNRRITTLCGRCKTARDPDIADALLFGRPVGKRLKRPMKRAFADLHEAVNAGMSDAKEIEEHLSRARFALINEHMPDIDLAIVDEAHKLKSTLSRRQQGLRQVLKGRFSKAVFLTATPFQLEVTELEQVLKLFALSRSSPDLDGPIHDLMDAIRSYQRAYDDFQDVWRMVDADVCRRFVDALSNPQGVTVEGDRDVAVLLRHSHDLIRLKEDRIEPGFRSWMIRTVRSDKKSYRQDGPPKRIGGNGPGRLPFLVAERFLAELFRTGGRTHKAANDTNLASSFHAAREGSLLRADSVTEVPTGAEGYRHLLRDLLGAVVNEDHPKVADTVRTAFDHALEGEKTLVFCARIESMREIDRRLRAMWESHLVERWRQIYPDVGPEGIFDREVTEDDGSKCRGRWALLSERFRKPQDRLYLALREPYLRTVLPVAERLEPHKDEIARRANEMLAGIAVGKTSAERLDYRLAKRAVEAGAAGLAVDRGWIDGTDPVGARLTDPDYLTFGYDLEADDYEGDEVDGSHRITWTIGADQVEDLVGTPDDLWTRLADALSPLEASPDGFGDRAHVVEQLAKYLTSRHVTFLPSLLRHAVEHHGIDPDRIQSRELATVLPSFLDGDQGRHWVDNLKDFLGYFASRTTSQRKAILDGPLRNVGFARSTRAQMSREVLRDAFNTPLFPVVLVANEVMQEGLDLHRHCRRILHHDLAWNPASMEQRVGRLDRLGSLVSRLRVSDPDQMLHILYPLIAGTIDERQYRVVKNREKWLDFMLGAPPDFDAFDLDHDHQPLPDVLVRRLTVDLSPHIEP